MKDDIALVMIARDAGATIRRCLDSVRPWVGRMLVLDTGSVDDTIEQARSAGACVHQAPWRDDFSQARNHALSLAGARWHLVLDADEWLSRGGELLDDLDEHPGMSRRIRVDSLFHDGREETTATTWITRVLPGHVRYRGRIHEQPVIDHAPMRLDMTVLHDGYQPEYMQRKHDRNLRMLSLSLQESPDDPYLHYQLGKALEAAGREQDALVHYERAWSDPVAEAWRHDLLIRLLHGLGQAGSLRRALLLAKTVQDQWTASPDFYFVVGELCLLQALADPADALGRWIPAARSAWTRCLAIGEREDLSGSVRGRGSHLAAHNLALIASLP